MKNLKEEREEKILRIYMFVTHEYFVQTHVITLMVVINFICPVSRCNCGEQNILIIFKNPL